MNNMKVEFEALPENEGFARVAVAAFLTPLNPTTTGKSFDKITIFPPFRRPASFFPDLQFLSMPD